MSALQYLNPVKIKYITAEYFKPKNVILECHRLSFSLINLASREIADSLSVWADRKLISSTDIAYFEKMVNADNDYLFSLYKERNFNKQVNDDFERITGMFNKLAEKSLSEFQRSSNPELVSYLSVIYALEFIPIAVSSVCKAMGRIPDSKNAKIINTKKVEVQELFSDIYKGVSNNKEFNFSQFDNVFKKITEMTRKEFIKYTDDL